eukprot:g2448.t1
MFEQLDEKTKEAELYIDAKSSYLLQKTQDCKSLIKEFEKQKKRLLGRVAAGQSTADDITSSLKSKLSALKDALFAIEEEVVEVLFHFNQEFESTSDTLSTKSKATYATLFTQIRDLLNGLSSKANTIGLGLHEKYVRESDIEKLSEEVKLYFQDKDALMLALQHSHDLKVSRVDTLEEELLHKESFTVQQNALNRNIAMKKRHCERVNEIISYIELNANEAEELNQELTRILTEPIEECVFPLTVNFIVLCDADPVLAHVLFRHPRSTLSALDLACVPAQQRLVELEAQSDTFQVKPFVRVRIEDLFNANDVVIGNGLYCGIGELSCESIGKFMSFQCTVVKTGEMKVIGSGRSITCPNCTSKVHGTREDVQCPHCDELCKEFSTQQSHCQDPVHSDYQEIKVQQSSSQLELTGVPRSVSVILHDDLVDTCQVGDEVFIVGLVTTRGVPRRGKTRATAEYAILANSIRCRKTKSFISKLNPVSWFTAFWQEYRRDRPLTGRNTIVSWVCPQIHAQWKIKLALLLVLIGGCQSQGSPLKRSIRRTQSWRNLGKSQFMKFASLVNPRCVMTNGRGSTSAGLTACAVKNEGQWTLEPGALVLADGGICCIDEFNGIQETDRAVVHEVMEQQTLSIAKGGLVTTLHARTSVFGCMNPVGGRSLNPRRTLSEISGLSWPLLSRFDIVFLVPDEQVEDSHLADHILNFHKEANDGNKEVTVSKLREYIDWIKNNFEPSMSEKATKMLKRYYQHLRQRKSTLSPKITVRALESLIRISQAHARLMARDEVHIEDAIISVLLYEASALSSGQLEGKLDEMLQSPNPDESSKSLINTVCNLLHY